ncbi:hypothetical protein [Streptomyces sp. NPDC048106]|uniref:hypothetical protein n=1 Tax=Streptomyces sp. NPDC048106 TaxID=3155750 RepID=UPI003456280C
MPDPKETPYTRSGRLYAALAVLRLTAGADTRLRTPDDHAPKTHPQGRIDTLLRRDLYDLLAKSRTGNHWPAAAEAFRHVPDLLTEGPIPQGPMPEQGLAEHRAGYDAQLAGFREKFPDLPS